MENRRPTLWIVLTCVFALGAVGLGIWALNAQSDADDAKADLAAAEQAASKATPAPTQAPAPAPTVDPATQQSYEDAKAELGTVSEDVAQIQSELETASANAEQAKQKAADATGAVDKLRAEADAFKAQAELTKTCLKGTLSALDQAYQSGGLEAATEQLKALAGQCKNATAS
jgi:chromosome segregation ATPase